MPKINYKQYEIKEKVKKNDIEFDFRDVQTKNPKTSGKTQVWLYTRDSLTKNMKPKKHWWDEETK